MLIIEGPASEDAESKGGESDGVNKIYNVLRVRVVRVRVVRVVESTRYIMC